MARWTEKSLRLSPRHTWRASPGCRICVADRGAVRFDVPEQWFVRPDSDSIKIHDREPPDDDAVLGVSYIRLPPIDWSGLPVSELLVTATKDDPRPIYDFGEIQKGGRGSLTYAWRDMRFIDPVDPREAHAHTCVARDGTVQALITFEYWHSDRTRCRPVWRLVLKTLRLDEYVADPRIGPTSS